MHGKGWYRETGVRIYSGEMVNGQFSGMGWMRHNHGAMDFKGEFVAGNRSGHGKLQLHVGVVHGEYSDDELNGLGYSVDSLENVYAGQYKNGRKHGYGVMDFHGLATYYGEWRNDQRIGCGVLERGTTIEARVYSALLGSVREGQWVFCNRTRECRTGLYCSCDEDAVRLLQQKEETYRACVDEAKEEALKQQARATVLRDLIEKELEGLEFPGANAEFLNITKTQFEALMAARAASTREQQGGASAEQGEEGKEGEEEPDGEDEIGAALMSDMISLTSMLSLFQFLRKMFEDQPSKLRLLWVLLGCGLLALYDKSVGCGTTLHAIALTYQVFTGEMEDEVLNATHSEL